VQWLDILKLIAKPTKAKALPVATELVKPSNKNFSPVKNLDFRFTKGDVHRLTATFNKKRKFH